MKFFNMNNFIIILLTILITTKAQEIDVKSSGNGADVISSSTSKTIIKAVNNSEALQVSTTHQPPPPNSLQTTTTDNSLNAISEFDFLKENIGFNPNDFEDLPSSYHDDSDDSDLGIDSSQSFESREYPHHEFPAKLISQYVDDTSSPMPEIELLHDDGVTIEKSSKIAKLKRKVLESLDHIQVIGKHDGDTKLKNNNIKIDATSKVFNNSNLGNFYTPNNAVERKNWKLDEHNQFYQIKNLFDHFEWDVKAIVGNVSKKCGEQMEHYLWNLRVMTEWAVKGKRHICVFKIIALIGYWLFDF